jgi:thiol:disulfide interchange protein DsbC
MTMKRLFGGLAAMLLSGAAGMNVKADETAVKEAMTKLLPDVELDSVGPAPVQGLYEVVIGPRVFYVSEDGHYLIQGNVIDTQTRENITEAKLAKAKKAAMDQVGEDTMIVFEPKEPKHTITVFTDIDCGYCRKLHREIDDYSKEGIRVRYLFFPRAGVGSPSYQKAISVWCADDRRQAMTDAKAGKPLESKTCDNPVQDHMLLGELMGVTGTPAIVLETGQLVPGYIPAKRMAMMLNGEASGK